jgi:hypothetical protein
LVNDEFAPFSSEDNAFSSLSNPASLQAKVESKQRKKSPQPRVVVLVLVLHHTVGEHESVPAGRNCVLVGMMHCVTVYMCFTEMSSCCLQYNNP